MSVRPYDDLSKPTLTNATYFGRLFLQYGLVVIVSLLALRVFLGAAYSFWKATHPDPPPPPTVGFGALPKIAFPKQSDSQKPKSYRLELATADFPQFSDRAQVFFMPKSTLSLLSDQKGRELASRYGFTGEPQLLDQRTYRWSKTGVLDSTFTLDVQANTFELKTNYQNHPELLTSRSQLPENFEAISQFKSFLNLGGVLLPDMATSSGQVSYLKSFGADLSPADSLSDADFLRIDLDRNPIDGLYKFYGQDGKSGAASAILSGFAGENNGIVEASFKAHNVDYGQVHTYPIRSVKIAWKIMQAGEGYVADKGKSSEAVIRSVSLGYFEPWDEQEYIQPIYVFVGDGGFVGYVPAVDPAYIQASGD